MSYIGNPIVSTDFPVDYASGNGSTTAFTLSIAPASVNSIDVQISGVSQSPQTYSVSGTTLTFTASPPSGTNNIVVRHLGVAGSPNVPALASVGVSQLSATGTPSSSTYLRGDNTWATVSGGTLIPSGTSMLFAQTAAPTGWTKSTTHDNKALRVVSGTAGSGGSVAFTTAFASQAVSGSIGTSGATTLSTSQMPSHSHGPSSGGTFWGNLPPGGDGGWPQGSGWGGLGNRYPFSSTDAQGGGGSHTHSGGTFTGTAINLAVQYVDVIIATKD